MSDTPTSQASSSQPKAEQLTPTTQPLKEIWPARESLFYNPRLPNNIGLPLPKKSILPRNEYSEFGVYNQKTGLVTLQPHPIPDLLVALGYRVTKGCVIRGKEKTDPKDL
ncbi:hypothetical protein WAI453_010719 [Rhynchosporium graminicola]|uniref:Uncharacterized protein n=1 Tax=Rhynchosporium graminicola TaxID=2792576 RepID=A0A1E1JSB3_9HELO|nr:uncharacterized protein RCO7_04412 [Rhynchosporium commune]